MGYEEEFSDYFDDSPDYEEEAQDEETSWASSESEDAYEIEDEWEETYPEQELPGDDWQNEADESAVEEAILGLDDETTSKESEIEKEITENDIFHEQEQNQIRQQEAEEDINNLEEQDEADAVYTISGNEYREEDEELNKKIDFSNAIDAKEDKNDIQFEASKNTNSPENKRGASESKLKNKLNRFHERIEGKDADAEKEEQSDEENFDDDFEDISIKEKIKEWIFDTTPSGILQKGLVVFFAVYYILMVSFQTILSVANSGPQTEKTYNPVALLFRFISGNSNYLLLILLIDLMLIAGIAIFVYRNNFRNKQDESFILSENGTYGTAKYASDEEISDQAMDFAPLHHPDGIPLGINKNMNRKEGGASVCVNQKSAINEHLMVYGSSGSGKSFCVVRSEILYCIENGHSAIISDPSGEMYYDTSKLARKEGCDVKVLNLTNFSASNGWNPFEMFKGMESFDVQTAANMFASTIMSNISDDSVKKDSFFDTCEENLLKALVMYVAISDNFAGKPYERHMGTVYDILQTLAASANADFALPFMDALPPDDPAKVAWDVFNGAGKLKNNIVLGLAVKLGVLQNSAVKEILSHDEISMTAPGEHQCIYYVISDVMNSAFTFLMSLFYSCSIEQLVQYGKKHGNNNKLKVKTYYIFDEFASIGRISGFAQKIANVRKYGISFTMIVQDPSQLDAVYNKDQVRGIISNCATLIVLKANDQSTAKTISDRCGEATIVNESYNETHSKLALFPRAVAEQRVSTADGKRLLLTPHEVLTLGKYEALIIAAGQNVYRCDKYPYKQHCFADFVDTDANKANSDEFEPPWKNEELTMNKPRTFLGRKDVQYETREVKMNDPNEEQNPPIKEKGFTHPETEKDADNSESISANYKPKKKEKAVKNNVMMSSDFELADFDA